MMMYSTGAMQIAIRTVATRYVVGLPQLAPDLLVVLRRREVVATPGEGYLGHQFCFFPGASVRAPAVSRRRTNRW